MNLFDSHTHIDMNHFQNDLEKVIHRAKEAGLVGMVTSSMGPGSFRRTIGIQKKHQNFVFHSAGTPVSQLTKTDADKIIELTRKYAKDIVAIGEVGLDYHWIKDSRGREAQEPLFSLFIQLAKDLDRPIVIHSRKAEERATEILEKQFNGDVLMHCFDGSVEIAQRVSDNGWYITLPANFERYRNRKLAAKIVPIEQIMLETDGPYLSPTSERNEPANIRYGCEALSRVLETDLLSVAEITTENAKRFYRL
ncbi:MAG: TatD family hydrolase [Candidatus Thorarchaeota archaeon]|nr:TatD family hydrolase [Candidatus Thorarchaeota archaeon]